MNTFKENQKIIDVDYAFYEALIDETFLNEPMPLKEIAFIDNAIKKSLGKLKALFKDLKQFVLPIADKLNISVTDIVVGLKQKGFYESFKLFGFNIKKMLKELNKATSKFKDVLLKIFEELHKTKAFQKIKKGVMTIDDIINKYPILNKITGIAVAAILFYIWLNMTFIGDLDFDFDFTTMAAALKGNFSLADVFASPDGMFMLSLFLTGGLISAPWLGTTAANILLAIIYTAYKNCRNVESEKLNKLKSLIKLN